MAFESAALWPQPVRFTGRGRQGHHADREPKWNPHADAPSRKPPPQMLVTIGIQRADASDHR